MRQLGTLASLALLTACSAPDTSDAPGTPGESRPNVVLVMTDDQGSGDFGFAGNRWVDTPELDLMAARSARLTSFYVSPVCSPTRASLMTGRYNQRTRAIDTWIGRSMLEPDEVTIAELLREAGYATGIFGKWHLGDCYPMRPQDQGFEKVLVHRGGGIGQPADPEGGEGKYTDAVLFEDGERVETEGYCTDVYFDAALTWMRAEHARGRPFFAYVATNAPHGPFDDVPRELYERYLERGFPAADAPPALGHPVPTELRTDRQARIFAMITNVDANIGKLFDALRDMGAYENTLVVFLDDNGPNTRRYVRGLRGMKSQVYEGGVRSPFLAHWPARLAPGDASERVAAHIDVLPTLLDACGVERPAGLALDGRSVLPLLERADVDWPDRTLVIQAHRGDVPTPYHNFLLRTERWKLVNASGFGYASAPIEPSFELYDMTRDPLEMEDVAAANPAVVTELVSRYDAWFADVSTTRPDNYAPPRILLGTDAERETHLTRQDWRQTRDGGWGGSSFGHWEVDVVDPGPYRVRVRFVERDDVRRVTLRLGGDLCARDVAEGARDLVLEDVELPLGPGSLEVLCAVAGGDEAAGAYQVIVTRDR